MLLAFSPPDPSQIRPSAKPHATRPFDDKARDWMNGGERDTWEEGSGEAVERSS